MNIKKKKQDRAIDFKYNLNLYFSFLSKYKAVLIVLLLFIFLGEFIDVAEKFLFKILIDRGTEFVNKNLALSVYAKIIIILAVIYVFALIVKSVSRWLQIHFINKLEGDVILDLRKKFFNHLVHLSYNFHTSHKTGSLISKLTRGGGAIERITDVMVFNFAPLIFQIILIGASFIYLDAMSAVIVIAVVIIFILYALLINNLQQKANVASNDAEDFEKAMISDVFTNIESIKYFGKEQYIKNKYAKISEATKDAMVKNWNYFRWFDSGQYLILGIGTFLLLYFSLTKFINGTITLGVLVFIYTVYLDIFGNLFSFVHGIRNFYRSMADFESLFQYAKIQNDVKDMPNAKDLKVTNGTIEFKNVKFSYKKRNILSNFSLKINKNQKVAFVGPSGAGKSTIIKILYRLYDLDNGEILIDNKNINAFKQESMRSELSIVPQECILFDDTIYNNISFSNSAAKREEVFNAIRLAHLDKIINKFPNKEKTIVGERGIKLSGGEKQRVSIARAILADKKILILDEATSSLDSETEHEIQNDLASLLKNRTAIIIAHRISTIINSDLIVVMDNGRILQQGTHNQLVKQEGLYKKLWHLQKGGYMK